MKPPMWAHQAIPSARWAENMAAVPLNPGIIDTDMLRSCFGESATRYPSPAEWAQEAVPFLLQLGWRDNGKPITAPGG